ALPAVLALDEAVAWALQNNPELTALRQQHGIAAAGVVIARTYPFNPVWEGKIRAVTWNEPAHIPNPVSNEHKFLWEVEVRGQKKHRVEGARAALARADWEIASQEAALALRVVRAFQAVLYREEKLRLARQTLEVNEDAVRRAGELVGPKKI